jgi:tRNA-Thr(GGU) m(6)t(6)A37 methyltransferase TsaA
MDCPEARIPTFPALPALRPIGVIRTPFQRATGTPIQSSVSRGAEGRVELFAGFEEGLSDLAGFERVWLLYCFDRASEAQLMVRPYLDKVERGIFATRSPARPNHIGMSPVRLLGVEGATLLVADVDMLDGTPLLDIKPYVPAFDHFLVERVGWYEGVPAAGAVADDRFEGR